MRRRSPFLPFLVLLVTVAGCESPLRVTNIQLGRSLNADNTIAAHTTTFAPHDTVYVSIATAGNAQGVIRVRWTYEGSVVGEPEKQVSYRGSAVTEFHLQNVGGFPPGEYGVEVFLNGVSAGSRTFRVDSQR